MVDRKRFQVVFLNFSTSSEEVALIEKTEKTEGDGKFQFTIK